MVTLGPGAGRAIRSFLSEKGLQKPLRIELQSSGCCDAVLGLSVDRVREDDQIYELDGLTVVISRETEKNVGDITISYVDDTTGEGFVITSTIPISEWAGFGVCKIKI
jgi:Fe-S cluster assembly iron-binding protein IscA